jgi:hypothetical protein
MFALLAYLKSQIGEPSLESEWPFYARKPLSSPEQVLYFRLVEAMPNHIVLAQVGLSRILGVKKGNNYQSWLNRVSRMSADFVVCERDSSILAVVELDDSSHEKESRKQADTKKDKALSSAGIRVIRWQVKSLPTKAEITEAFTPNKTLPLQRVGAHK